MLYLELIAKWKESFKGQAGTFDLDIVESLQGMASTLRLLRSLLSVLNLENFILFKKNKIFEWLEYLRQCYPKIHDLIYHIVFNDYSIHKHMTKEHERKRSINKAKLKYYCDRIGIVGQKRIKNSNDNTNNKSKPTKANLNITNKKKVERKTKEARRAAAAENKKKKQLQKERARYNKSQKQKNHNKKSKKKKKVKIKDLLQTVNIEATIQKYSLFVENVINQKNNIQINQEVDNDDDDKDDTNSDLELIEECYDEISETESESAWVPDEETEYSD